MTFRTLWGALLSAVTLTATANDLPDPTRPPAAQLDAPAASPAAADVLQLQSVLIGKGRTPAAVISGQLVLLGGRVRDARLVRVTERHAVLKGPQGDTILALLPAANPTRRTPGAPESTP